MQQNTLKEKLLEQSKIRKLSNSLLAVGTVVFAASPKVPAIIAEQSNILHSNNPAFPDIGHYEFHLWLFFLVSSLFLLIFGWIIRKTDPVINKIKHSAWKKILSQYEDQSTQPLFLENLWKFGSACRLRDTGQDTFVKMDALKFLYSTNTQFIRAWHRRKTPYTNTQTNPSCYFVIAPLNRRGCDRILKREIKTNKDLKKEDLSPSYRRSVGIYIIEVYGSDQLSKATVLYLLKKNLIENFYNAQYLKYIFSRPVNKFGKSQISRHAFINLGDTGTDMHALFLANGKTELEHFRAP